MLASQYINYNFVPNYLQVLEAWEKCCEIVESREYALKMLETFEQFASNPTRHFSKCTLIVVLDNVYIFLSVKVSSSMTRLREAKQRSALHQVIYSAVLL